MHQALSTSNGLALALCSEEPGHVTSFGDGLEISLARAGDQVAAPEWVQVLPLGPQIVARDGRRFTLTDPQALLANLRAKTADLPMDIEHATEIRAPKGEDAPAQGWAKDYELRDDGIWARVDWTPSGARKVADKEYRYVSPAIRHTPTGEIVSLSSFALTTQPALVMPALAHAQRPTSDKKDPPQMSLHARLAAALGLVATATEDELITAATSQVSLAREARDPAKYVPAADLTTALARAKSAEDKLAERDATDATKAAEATVDGANAAGKIAQMRWLSPELPNSFARSAQ